MSGVEVNIEPETFTLVSYDSAQIAALVAEAASWVGMGPGDVVRIKVDESSPLSLATLESSDPVVIAVEGGAFEDLKHIRQLDPVNVQTVVVRVLARVADRRLPSFAGAPAEGAVTVPQLDCWDVTALGRAARNGLSARQQPWRNRFRTRHGFTDVADRVFDRLWTAPDVSWADIEAACEETTAAKAVSA